MLVALVTSVGLLAGCKGDGGGYQKAGDTGDSSAANPGQRAEAGQPNKPAFSSVVSRSALRERALDLLATSAFDSSPEVRANAIEAMDTVPSRVEPIVRAALGDSNLGVRYVAAMTVGKLTLTDTAPMVRPLLSDPDQRVRLAAIYALTRCGHSVDPAPLSDALLYGSFNLRSHAAFILGETGNSSAVPMLRDAANNVNESSIVARLLRLEMAEALAKLGDQNALYSLRAALYPAAADRFEEAVIACQAIGQIHDRQSAAQLIQIIEYKATSTGGRRGGGSPYIYPPELRLAAATALAKMGFDDGVYVADEHRSDDNPALRAQTAFLYAEAARRGDLGGLGEMMDSDPSAIVRVAAAAAVLRLLTN